MMGYFKRRIKSFAWAFKGVADLFKQHPNAQIHLLATVVVVPSIFIFELSSVEACIIVLCIVLVLSMEALNSALEYLADRVSSEQDELIGKCKDIAAAAVLIAAIGAAIIAAIIFLPKIYVYCI